MSQQLTMEKMLQGGVVAALKLSGSLDAPIALQVRPIAGWRWASPSCPASPLCRGRAGHHRPPAAAAAPAGD